MIKITMTCLVACVVLGLKRPEIREDSTKEVMLRYKQDGRQEAFYQVLGDDGIPVYYYKNIDQYPCKNKKECKVMNLKMYWDIYGNYLKYEIKKEAPLTKLNHKPFNEDDYLKLHKILNNPDSEFKMCTYDDLTSEEVENQYHVDAISGATLTEIDFEYINGAIKTSYALWKLAHGNICEVIRKQTLEILQAKMEKKEWIHQLENSSPETMAAIFLSGDDKDKMFFYSFLASQNHHFEPEMMELLKSQVLADKAMVYAGALNNLANIPVDRSYCKAFLLPLLTKRQGLKYMVTYNAIQRSGQARLLKKQKINVWSE